MLRIPRISLTSQINHAPRGNIFGSLWELNRTSSPMENGVKSNFDEIMIPLQIDDDADVMFHTHTPADWAS